ncbi:UV-B-induced protein At3g17800, chloroplastic [Linum perenne]
MEFVISNHCLSHRSLSFSGKGIGGAISSFPYRRSSSTVLVARAGSSHSEPSSGGSRSMNIPIELRSAAGKLLKDVFENQRQRFDLAVGEELKHLAGEKEAALNRLFCTGDPDHAVLDRRIVDLKERECREAAEEIMYMLILHKFSEIKVPLVPKLTKYIHNGRLEPLPQMDYELESIHTPQVLELIKERVSEMTSLRLDSSITDSCTTTEINMSKLTDMYNASIFNSYFLKSVSVRHGLEQCLGMPQHELHHVTRGSNFVFWNEKRVRSRSSGASLKSYLMGFDHESLRMCTMLRSNEAMNLIARHSRGVFGDGNCSGDDADWSIVASFSSLRRLMLEATAFGRFLWESEEYVDSVFGFRG